MITKEIKDKEDLKQAAKLAELCFHEDSAEDNVKFLNHLKDLYFIGTFEEDILLAAAGFYEFQIFIRDQLYKCSGIANVMTHPIQRKKGCVKKLMLDILKKSYTDGYEVSALWPFNHKFYQKFGYEIAEKPVFYKIKPSNIKEIKVDENITIRESKGKEDYAALNKIASYALNKNTRIIGKHDAWFLRGETSKFKIFIFEKENQPVGFISFKFEQPKDKQWVNHIQVVDWAYEDIETKKSILSFLKNFESDISEIKITLPYEEEMLIYLKEFNTIHSIANWPAMIRIINLKKIIEKMIFQKNVEKSLLVEIKDSFIPENEGLWNFKIKAGKCNAQKISKEDVDEEQILGLTINQLSQIIVGVASVKSLTELESGKTPDEWLDNLIFPTVPCWIGVWF
ncbi:MAG: GNAT family N-acetyltransferase [Asgard group archaeon]|nr:GNAT family N-acetyltransferase [Asgard group archaeon]